MRVTISNDGDATIRVIEDGDTVNDSLLGAGETKEYSTPEEGKIELREMGDAPQT